MSSTLPTRRRWFQFGLGTLFVLITLAAVIVWGGRAFHSWYYSTPLDDAVASFNERATVDRVGRWEPPLTEDEVVDSLLAQLPIADASQQVNQTLSRIARTRRLPQRATIDVVPGIQSSDGSFRTVWHITLSIMTGPKSGFSVAIRKTNDPVIEKKAREAVSYPQ